MKETRCKTVEREMGEFHKGTINILKINNHVFTYKRAKAKDC